MVDENNNTSDYNTGNYNTGDYNTGYKNAGNCNTGNNNTGDYNTGNNNTGNCNTGYRNAGNYNTGNNNTGDYNTGYCNTITPDDCLIFNKPAKRKDWENADKPNWLYVNLTEWVESSKMTDKEKESYPSYITTGGYLKCYSSLQHAFIESWDKASLEDKLKTLNLPNYDESVFKEIFGFTPKFTQKVTLELANEQLAKIKEIIKE